MTDSSSKESSRHSGPLRPWERTLALIIGVVFSVLAIVALYTSANQAGTAALLLVSAAFLLIGVQGTALVRLGGGSASLELDRRVATAVQRAAEVAETDPELARGILEGAAIIEPRVGPATGAFQAMTYEHSVRRALERVIPDDATIAAAQPPVDLRLVMPGGDVLVSAVYRRSRNLQMIDLAPMVSTRQLENAAAGLVVTNRSLSSSVTDYVATATGQGLKIEVITWNGPEDDVSLTHALNRLRRAQAP